MKQVKFLLFPILLFILSLPLISSAQQYEGDRILAVVGNEIILESDLQYQMSLYARQNKMTSIPPDVAQEIFNNMLTDKIILAKADQDSIEVSEDEINKELDSRIKSLIDQVGTQSRLEEIYEMSIVKIRLLLKEDLRKRLKTEKLKRQQFSGGIKSSDREVRAFFEMYKDSLPSAPEEFEIAHIYLDRKVSDAEKNFAKDKAKQILDSIKMGVDFSELAKRHSGDSLSAIQGGDLGYVKKGTFVKPYEEAVLTMEPGEVSELVETQFGYHIIKLTEKKGDGFSSRHILIMYPKFESSDLETIKFLNDLRADIVSGKTTFEDAAKQYSTDESTKLKGGYVGTVTAEQIDSTVYGKLKNVSVNDITDAVRVNTSQTEYGYEIIKLINKMPEHKLTIDGDYDRIKRFADQYKEGKEIEKWIAEMKKSIYIDTRF